jgi:hypothetical protein
MGKIKFMKAIDKLKALIIEEFKPEVALIRFKHAASGQRIKRKGYAVWAWTSDKSTHMKYLTIEPVDYFNGDKWLYYGSLTDIVFGYHSVHYAKNIHEIIRKLNKK